MSWLLPLALVATLGSAAATAEDLLVHRGDGFELTYPKKHSKLQPASAAVPFQLEYRKNSLLRLETEPLTQPITLTDETFAEIFHEVQLERLQQRIGVPVGLNRIRPFPWGVGVEFEYTLPARNGKKNQRDRVVEVVTTVDKTLYRFTHWIPEKDWKKVAPSFTTIVDSFAPERPMATDDVAAAAPAGGGPAPGLFSVAAAEADARTFRAELERQGLSVEAKADYHARLAKALGWKAYLTEASPEERNEMRRSAEAAAAAGKNSLAAQQALAWSAYHDERMVDMENAIQAATAIDPKDAESHLLHALWYGFNPERSKAMVARALDVDADFVPALFVKATIDRSSGDLAEARRLLERAVSHDPGFARAHLELGEVLVESGSADAAVRALRAAASSAPGDVSVRFRSAVALRRAGKIDEAIEAYRATLGVDDTLPEAHYNLAVLLLNEKGREDLCRPHFRRFVELSPESGRASQVRQWLAANPAGR